MERAIQSVSACFKKPDTPSQSNTEKAAEKQTEQAKTDSSGLVWRLGSGLYAAGANATNAAISGAKWAATTTYSISNSVVGGGVNTVKKMTGLAKEKPKSE